MFNLENNKFWENYFGVVNLSNRKLTNIELTVLGKGLKFCPTPLMVDHGKIKENLDRFMRTCSLRLFFSGVESSDSTIEHNKPFSHKDLKLPSKFSQHMPSNLEHIYYLILDDILSHSPPNIEKCKLNMTSKQRLALRNLTNYEDIIIKKADKGSNVVVQNRPDHIQECLRQLSDKRFYLKLDKDLTPKFRLKVCKLIESMHAAGEIDDQTLKYLLTGGNRTPIFYILPKIHKKFVNNILPGRPIVSSVESLTEKLSQLIDIILQPYAQKGESFILDTGDF